jgi:hypothetical protein
MLQCAPADLACSRRSPSHLSCSSGPACIASATRRSLRYADSAGGSFVPASSPHVLLPAARSACPNSGLFVKPDRLCFCRLCRYYQTPLQPAHRTFSCATGAPALSYSSLLLPMFSLARRVFPHVFPLTHRLRLCRNTMQTLCVVPDAGNWRAAERELQSTRLLHVHVKALAQG